MFLTTLLAQGEDQGINLGTVQNGRGVPAKLQLNTFLQNVFTIIFAIAALAVLYMLIMGAFNWITSGGDKDKIAAARKQIINALVGLAILALAFFVVTIVGKIIGFDILNNFSIPWLGHCTPGPGVVCPPAS